MPAEGAGGETEVFSEDWVPFSCTGEAETFQRETDRWMVYSYDLPKDYFAKAISVTWDLGPGLPNKVHEHLSRETEYCVFFNEDDMYGDFRNPDGDIQGFSVREGSLLFCQFLNEK